MRILIALLTITTIINNCYGQNMQGIITYKTVFDTSEYEKQLNDPEITLSEREEIEKSMQLVKNILERTHLLKFTNNESIYELADELSLTDEKELPRQDGGDIYKNLKNRVFINKIDFGIIYLVKDSLKNYKWELHNEVKKIGEHTCYKATYTERKLTHSRKEKEDGTFEFVPEHKDFTTTAWYTLQIPISNGPSKYGGLPGLILEVDYGSIKITCEEILINPKKEVTVVPPKRGKLLTEKEYKEELDKLRKG